MKVAKREVRCIKIPANNQSCTRFSGHEFCQPPGEWFVELTFAVVTACIYVHHKQLKAFVYYLNECGFKVSK